MCSNFVLLPSYSIQHIFQVSVIKNNGRSCMMTVIYRQKSQAYLITSHSVQYMIMQSMFFVHWVAYYYVEKPSVFQRFRRKNKTFRPEKMST